MLGNFDAASPMECIQRGSTGLQHDWLNMAEGNVGDLGNYKTGTGSLDTFSALALRRKVKLAVFVVLCSWAILMSLL